jgi:hypothetical protein
VIRCEDAVHDLWSYLADEATHMDRQHIAEHLEACRRCCGELEFLRELRHFLGLAGGHLPGDVAVRMEAFLANLEGSDGRPDAQG